MGQYPAVVIAFGSQNSAINNASSILTTTNENNASVAVGYARPQSTLVSWLLIVEQSHHEAWEPTYKLRNIVLACVFGTIGLILIIVLPLAHFSVRPIRRLRDATEKSIAPPGYTPNGSIRSGRLDEIGDISGDEENAASQSQREKKGLFVRLRRLAPGMKRKSKTERTEDERRRVNKPLYIQGPSVSFKFRTFYIEVEVDFLRSIEANFTQAFKIPGKVQDRKHFITDELTEVKLIPCSRVADTNIQ
jgi:osomolarity two-component system sensor histidine kinase SLN1